MTMEPQQPVKAEAEASQVPSSQQTSSIPDEAQSVIVTIRMIVDNKMAGSIIGKKGDNAKRYREASGAKINISEANTDDRIVTITGTLEQIRKAYHLMCIKFEDDLRANTSPGSTLPPVNVRLAIPASQCGSLIGKRGVKIKELGEVTGACVSVTEEVLPNSSERLATITGGAASISHCVKEVCSIMLDSPPKGATIPYRPKPTPQAQMMYGMPATYGLPGQVHGMPGQGPPLPNPGVGLAGQPPMAVPPQLAASVSSHPSMSSPEGAKLMAQQPSPVFSQAGMPFPQGLAGLPGQAFGTMSQQGAPLILPPTPTAGLNSYALLQQGLGVPGFNAMNAAYMAGGRQMPMMPGAPQQNQSVEMNIPNELIGCIIGRGGAKVNEIRQLSGAQIKISKCEEGSNDRNVLISGPPDMVAGATFLINTSVENHKTQLLWASQEQANSATSHAASTHATSLTPSSVSTQSNSQTQLTNSFVAAAPSAMQLPQLQKLATQLGGQPHLGALPYGLNAAAALPQGYPLPLPQYGLASAYVPKTMLAAANKLKMLPTPPGRNRYAPY